MNRSPDEARDGVPSPAVEDTYIEGAVTWALGQVGSTEYAYRCLAFVEDAYERGNPLWLDGQGCTAKETADAYQAQEHSGAPSRGAYVCYDCWGTIGGEHRNWGHVGISVGDGRVVHAWASVRVDDHLVIQDLAAPGWSQPAYSGGVPVSAILKGSSAR